MSLSSTLGQWLEHSKCQEQYMALQSAGSLPSMVYAALQLGLMLARWLLESELSARASRPAPWPLCPTCGHRFQSKGWQPRQMQTLVGTIA
ncbi:MAG: hypothetical protein AAFY26_25540 [Cyanobacteria bacterium J06638_22]